MKKVFSLVLVLALALGCVALSGCSGDSGKSDEKVIRIGIFQPASGQNAAGGKQETLGIRYANSVKPTVTINGESYKVELVEVDNASDDTKAVTAAQTLIDKKVSVVLGSYGSSVSIAAGTYFKQAQIPAIGCSCTNSAVTEGNDYYFRVCFLDPFQGTVMASFAKERGAKNALVVTEAGDAYSEGLGSCFKTAFEKQGGSTVAKTFQTNETNFKSLLQTAVDDKTIDVIFAPSSIASAPLIIAQARELGITCPIMAGDTWENQSIIENAGAAATDVFLSTFFDENDESAADFVTGFKAWLNADKARLTNNGGNDGVAAVTALGYDAYMTAIAGIEKANSTEGAKIRDALVDVSTDGVTGAISFDENGDAKKTVAYIKTVKDGNFSFVKKQSV